MEEENKTGRYDRQKLIKGWNQDKLTEGTASIIGSAKLAERIALPLVALGVGNIRIIDSSKCNEHDMLLDISLNGDSRAKGLEKALKKINPEVSVTGIHSSLLSKAAQYFLEGSDVIIEATNNLISKANTLDYHSCSGIPLISASCGNKKGKAIVSLKPDANKNNTILMPMFNGTEQGDLVSLELGGVIAEEAKKILMSDAENIEKIIMKQIYNYNLESNILFGFKSDIEIRSHEPEVEFKGKKILQVGAGAGGCFLGPSSLYELRPEIIDIMDDDQVKSHNLNRQVCFYDAVGEFKAERLKKTLETIASELSIGTKIRALKERFTEKSKFGTKYDLIFDAVDSYYSKAILHNFAKRNNIPLISGGSDPRAIRVLNYVPGKTSCFDCQINLSELAVKAEIVRRTSCIEAPDPSVIMTNQIAAVIMVGLARRALRPDIYGEPINGEIKYISDIDSRGGVNLLNKVCRCYSRKVSSLKLPSPKRVKVKEKEVDGEMVREVYLDRRRI